MDTLQARDHFMMIAASYMVLMQARGAADKARIAFQRRTHEHIAYEVTGLCEIDAALRRQRVTLRQCVEAALRAPLIDQRDVIALQDMLTRSMALLGPCDESTALLAKAIAAALAPKLKNG